MIKNTNFKVELLDLVLILFLVMMIIFSGLTYSNYLNSKSYFDIEKTSVDYIIQAPTTEQVLEISHYSDVTTITPYLFFSEDANVNNKSIRLNLYVLEQIESLNKTIFSDELLVSKAKINYENPVFISDDFARVHNLKIGDKISTEILNTNIEFQVQKIFLSDKRTAFGTVIAIKQGQLETAITSNYGSSYKYGGAYIESNDLNKTNKWLKDYQPKGLLKERSEFTSDELYALYLNSFNSTDYTLTTFNRENYVENLHNIVDQEIRRSIIITFTVQVISVLLMIVFINYRTRNYMKTEVVKDKKNNFTFLQEKAMFNKYLINILLISLLSFVLLIVVNILLFELTVFSLNHIVGLVFIVLAIFISKLLQEKKLKTYYIES